MAEKKNDYYVHVSDANALLKKVLLSSKLVVSSSQSYYKTLEIRREKTILFSKLRSEVKDLLQLSKQLESSLPYKELIAIEKKKLSKPKQKDATKKKTLANSTTKKVEKSSDKKKALSKEDSEALKLSKLLESINEKLDALD